MTNPTPHGQVPEALRLAEEISNLVCSSEAAAKTIAAAADELCRLHVENASLRAQQPASPPAEQQAPSAAAADTVVLEAALRAIHQAIDLIGEPDTERLRTVRRVLRGAVIVAEDAGEADTAPQPAPESIRSILIRCREFIDTTKVPAYPAGADLADEIDVLLAPQPAPAPLSEMPYEKRKAIQEGEQIGASDAWFKARHEMLDTVDRRNVFRAGFDRGWNAALAAQGGRDA